MLNKERYNRQLILPEIGEEGQIKLRNAKILVVGAGGLGSPVLSYLAAAGIGKIGIVDDDTVSLSNLQRQILYTGSQIGAVKVEKAKERLLAINEEIEVETYSCRLSKINGMEIAKPYDLIVDCTDNYESRYVIDSICKKLRIPMVYASISQFKGQLSVFNYKGGKSYSDIFKEAPEIDITDVSRLGVLGVLPGVIGSMQANEVLKIILNISGVLSNKLYLFDCRTMESQILDY